MRIGVSASVSFSARERGEASVGVRVDAMLTLRAGLGLRVRSTANYPRTVTRMDPGRTSEHSTSRDLDVNPSVHSSKNFALLDPTMSS